MTASPAGAHEGDTVLPPEGEWTQEQEDEAMALVHEAEAVLPANFSDVSAIEAMGYYNFGVPTPNGYWHYINPSYFNDGHLLNPERPESLVYKGMPDGSMVLEAAMFFLDFPTTMETIPEDMAWWPGWHQHPELCTVNGRFSGIIDGEGNCARGEPGVGPPMIHVWIVDTECGHRFGGLGVQGSICDPEGGHGHGDGDGHGHDDPPATTPPDTTPPETTPPETTPPVDEEPPPAPPVTEPDDDGQAPPATPVPGEPNYTG